MSIQPQTTQVATSWPGNFVVDDLVVPLVGGNPVDTATIAGTLKQDVLSTSYSVTVLTFAFAPQTIGIRFRTAAGASATPPSAAETSELHLAIFRPLPVR